MENFFKKSSYNPKKLLDIFEKIKKIPWILGKNAFLCILMLIFIDVLIGGFLFYKYVLVIDTKETENISNSNKFQENTYRSVLEEWKNRENILGSFLLDKNYTDPFKQNSIKLK